MTVPRIATAGTMAIAGMHVAAAWTLRTTAATGMATSSRTAGSLAAWTFAARSAAISAAGAALVLCQGEIGEE